MRILNIVRLSHTLKHPALIWISTCLYRITVQYLGGLRGAFHHNKNVESCVTAS